MALFALAAIGLSLAGAGQVWQTAAQREKEAELLFVGHQFRLAIRSYLQAPSVESQYPANLEDLVEDRRFQVTRHHLRKLYRDPMTGSREWGVVRAGGRIVGVHSLSTSGPLKTSFEPRNEAFTGASSYDQWLFLQDGLLDKP